MSDLQTPPHDSLAMPRGSSRAVYLAAGTTVISQQGTVRLTEPPQWLADQVCQPWARIAPNTAHQLQQSGWVRLDAIDDCQVRLLAPAPVPGMWERISATLAATLQAWQASARARTTADGA